MPSQKRYNLLFIPAFKVTENSQFMQTRKGVPKDYRLMNYDSYKHLLEDVNWDLHEGPELPYGDWPVENREEFCLVAAARLPIVRNACKSGKYNGIVLLGGGEPGFLESREIGRKFGIPVTSSAFAQMHFATMLGNKFSVIDLAESHNMYYYNLVVQHRFTDRCASIRNINFPLPRPDAPDRPFMLNEREKALQGETSEAVERAVVEAVTAIEDDGAEVLTFGCAATFWLQPFVKARLYEMGWEIPVLEGYSCSIALVKSFIDLGVDASGLTFPGDTPKTWRRKKTF